MNQQQLQINDKEPSALPAFAASDTAFGPQEAGVVMGRQAVMEEVKEGEEDHAATSSLAMLLQKEAQARSRETTGSLVWSGSFLGIMLLVAEMTDASTIGTRIGLFCLLMMSIGVLLSAYLIRRSYRRKHVLAGALAQAQDVSHIGSLIEATKVENTPVRNLAKKGLIQLLPALQASDAPLLMEAHRDRLLRFLAISPNDRGYRDLTELFSRSVRQREIDLRLAILKALEQVGGAKELSAVERLARGLPNLQSASKVPQEVKDAASECLPYLQSRVSEQRASEQLLRASSAHAASNDILLRPASSRTDAAPEQLLRPSETV